MVHGDDSGLVLPPRIAPTQVMVIPIQQKKAGILDKAAEIRDALKAAGIRTKMDDTDKSPGYKFAEAEIRGIPLRVEIGPRDLENGNCVIVRRDTREKTVCAIEDVAKVAAEIMDQMHDDMLARAKAHLETHITDAHDYDEFKDAIENKPGFVRAMWCGDVACEEKIKADTTATSRCMPFEQEEISKVCVCCGKPAKKLVFWGKAY
jgi:prolyl-tRNA synthetase